MADNIRDELKLKMYETFRNRIDKAEDRFWKYILFYLAIIIGINGIIWKLLEQNVSNISNTFNTNISNILIVVSTINAVLSTIGIAITLEHCKWLFRNIVFITNLERRILKDEHNMFIPYNYTKFENINKVLDTNASLFVSLFTTIFVFSIFTLDFGVKGILSKILENFSRMDSSPYLALIVISFYMVWLFNFWTWNSLDRGVYPLIKKVWNKIPNGHVNVVKIGVELLLIILPFYYILKGPEYYSIASFILFLGICGIFYFNAKKHVETTIKELDTNPENDENIKKHYIIHNLSKSYYLVKEAIDERNGEKKKEKLKKSKELIEEAIKLLNGTPTSNSIREVLDFAKIRIREAINDILNNNIDGEHGAINKLKEALKIINYNIGD